MLQSLKFFVSNRLLTYCVIQNTERQFKPPTLLPNQPAEPQIDNFIFACLMSKQFLSNIFKTKITKLLFYWIFSFQEHFLNFRKKIVIFESILTIFFARFVFWLLFKFYSNFVLQVIAVYYSRETHLKQFLFTLRILEQIMQTKNVGLHCKNSTSKDNTNLTLIVLKHFSYFFHYAKTQLFALTHFFFRHFIR
jgi:hypothetical protein